MLVVKHKNTSLLSSEKITFCCVVQALRGLTRSLLAQRAPDSSWGCLTPRETKHQRMHLWNSPSAGPARPARCTELGRASSPPWLLGTAQSTPGHPWATWKPSHQGLLEAEGGYPEQQGCDQQAINSTWAEQAGSGATRNVVVREMAKDWRLRELGLFSWSRGDEGRAPWSCSSS